MSKQRPLHERFRAALCVALGLPQATSENDVLSRVAVIASAQRDAEKLFALIQEQQRRTVEISNEIAERVESLRLPVFQNFEHVASWRPLTKDSRPAEGQLVALWGRYGYHEIRVWTKNVTGKFTHWHPETRPAPPSTRIDDQDTSVRFAILCEKAGIDTLEALAERGEYRLKQLGFTAKMLKEARALLAERKT